MSAVPQDAGPSTASTGILPEEDFPDNAMPEN